MGQELIAYFFEREDAEEVARRLPGDIAVRRERFHGEDDDEDHPWIVVPPADVDRALVEELVAQYDGWLAGHEPAQPRPEVQAAPLPDAPRRFKNPDSALP